MNEENTAWRPPTSERWTPAEGAAAVAAFRASGLSLRGFCTKYGVGAHRVSYWRDREAAECATGSGFVAARVVDDDTPTATSLQIELALSNGRIARITNVIDESSFRRVVRMLEAL